MKQIKQTRKAKGMTQYDLEYESGISQTVISKIENGQEPTEFQLIKR